MTTTMTKKEMDLNFGKKNEIKILPTIKRYFGYDNLEIDVNNPFLTIDFINDDVCIELKTRRINHDKYETAFIGYNKYQYFKKNRKKLKCHIVYKYEDGLYYITYDKSLFKTFEKKVQDVWRDGRCEKSKVVLIPTNNLIKIED